MEPGNKQVLDLADEFLSDVATGFFDARCKLDAMIEAFEATAAELGREAVRVAGAAAIFWNVMIEDAAAQGLLCRLKVDPAPFAAAARRAAVHWCLPVQPLWGRRRRYRFVVAEAYRILAEAVDRYQDGLSGGADQVYYHLVREMARLINTHIEAVNRQCSPSEILSYAKQFDSARIEREYITGAVGSCCGLDQGLCYKPLDFEALDLPVFSRLAPPDQARDEIFAAADGVYRHRPEAVAALLERLKKTVPKASSLRCRRTL